MPANLHAKIGRFRVTKSLVNGWYQITGIEETEISPRVVKAIERIKPDDAEGWARFWAQEAPKINREFEVAARAANLAP